MTLQVPIPTPQAFGWTVDMNHTAGERLYDIQVRDRDGTELRALSDAETLNVVTNSFTAGGRDSYVAFGTVSDDGRAVDTFLDYAQSFVDYTLELTTLSKPSADEYSTQSFTPGLPTSETAWVELICNITHQ